MVGSEWSDWAKSPASVGGANTANIHVGLEADVDAHCKRARQAGAIIEMEPEDQFYGRGRTGPKTPKGTSGPSPRPSARCLGKKLSGPAG
jgi:hypothetical protein